MEITIRWYKPEALSSGWREQLIYRCELSNILQRPGVYAFARIHHKGIEPIYIGETLRLRDRIGQHLQHVRLMKAIEARGRGRRVVLYGTLGLEASAARQKPILRRVERALIKHALANGHELVNKHGTRTTHDVLQFRDPDYIRNLFGKAMNVER